MSLDLVRMRFAAVAVKTETTPGTDAIAGVPAATDWLSADLEVDFDPVVVENSELTGTLDRAPAIVGGVRPRIRLRLPLRGSGSTATAPEWGKLLRCCTFSETTNAAVAATALGATGHTTTTVTLPTTPYGNTAQQYRGQPLVLTGAVADTTGITDYTTGRVATLGSTLSAIPAATTSAAIPANILYAPSSDEAVYKNATLYFFADGMRWRFTGASGTWSLELSTGGIGFLVFDLRATFLGHDATALPTGWNTTIRQTPPRFVAGRMQLNQAKAQVRRLALDAGISVVLPDDPEAAEGYGPALPIERDSRGSIDPLINTTTSVALFNAFRAGTAMPLMAIIGSTAGNRFLVTCPAAKATGFRPGNREGLGQYDIAFQLDGADSPLYLAAF